MTQTTDPFRYGADKGDFFGFSVCSGYAPNASGRHVGGKKGYHYCHIVWLLLLGSNKNGENLCVI